MNKKIKIVHVAQANGGVERYLKMFFKYSTDKYENYLIVSKQYSISKEEFEKLGVRVYIVDMVREVNIINDIVSMGKIFKILYRIKPDFVYSHSSKAGGLARLPAILLRAKNIYNPHGWAFDMNISNKKKKVFIAIEKLLAYITHRIVAISRYEKNIALDKRIIKEDKIITIENGIDLDAAKMISNNNILDKVGWKKDDVIIGMVARISEQKSPKTFVEIAEKVSNIIPNSKFIIVGDGEQKEIIEELISKKSLSEKFHITGWVENPHEYVNLFDYALLTSKWEGFGLVIPEYMIAKKVVIASNVGGISNIIEDCKTGFLVNNLDVNRFVDIIVRLNQDRKIKSDIENNAYKLAVNKYNFKRVIHEHDLVFNNI